VATAKAGPPCGERAKSRKENNYAMRGKGKQELAV
jgi:hypothetical protein